MKFLVPVCLVAFAAPAFAQTATADSTSTATINAPSDVGPNTDVRSPAGGAIMTPPPGLTPTPGPTAPPVPPASPTPAPVEPPSGGTAR